MSNRKISVSVVSVDIIKPPTACTLTRTATRGEQYQQTTFKAFFVERRGGGGECNVINATNYKNCV